MKKLVALFGLDDKNALNTALDKFFYSFKYPALIALLAVFSFVTKMQMGCYAIFLALTSVLLVMQRDATPILPLLIFFITMFRDLSVTGSLLFYLMLIPLVVCLIIHFIKFPPIPFCFGKLFLPLLAVTTALFAGGLMSPYISDYVKGLLYILPLGPGLTLIYLYFNNYLRPPENFDSKKYLCLLLMLLGLVCTLEFIFYYYNYYYLQNNLFSIAELGWANVNGIGSLILLSIPATCYLFVKSKSITIWSVIILLFYFTIFSTKSDASLGISVTFLPFMVFIVYKKLSKHKRNMFFILLCAIGVCVCLACIALTLTGKMQEIIDKILKAFQSDSGRSKLYRDALSVFLENPLFGGGMGYYNDHILQTTTALRNFNFHSTFFTVIGCMGMFGFLAYVYYFHARYKILIECNTSFNVFMFIAFTMFVCHGFIDTSEFSTIPQMIVATIIMLITDLTNTKGNESSLPLAF